MTDQQTTIRIRDLEHQNKWLARSLTVLAIVLGFVSGLIPLAILGLMVLLPVLAVIHQWLPGIARSCGQLLHLVFGPTRHTT